MAHCVVAEAEAIIDAEIAVHEGGFVRLVDYLGGDERIVQAARVSYGEGTKTFREDKGLINYLLRNDHTSPFEQVVLTFHLKMPIFVARQWIRHRTARVNEISGRYSVMSDEFYLPAESDIAEQSSENKQGRKSEPAAASARERALALLKRGQRRAYEEYEALLAEGIAREIARINLPLSIYTELYWQIDLRNLFHFLKLRLDPHAQKETRDYALVVHDVARRVSPIAVDAFDEYQLASISLSRRELEALQARLSGKEIALSGKARERFEAKLRGEKVLS